MVRPVQSVTVLPVLIMLLCKLVVTVPVETANISIFTANANDSVVDTPVKGGSVIVTPAKDDSVVVTPAKDDPVPDIGNSVPNTSSSISDNGNSVPDKNNSVSAIDNSVSGKINSVPTKENSDTDKGNQVSTIGISAPDNGNSVLDKPNSVSINGNSDPDEGDSVPNTRNSAPDKSNEVPKSNRAVRQDSAVSASNSAAVNGSEDNSVPTGPIEYYKTKYDHVDIETLLNNRRMVNYYAKCMLNQAPCPPDGAEFKRILPDAIRTNCLRCTEKQKAVTIRAVKRLMKEYPKVWTELAKAWDPNDIYVKKFVSTYSSWEYQPVTTPKNVFANRFDDGDDENNHKSSNDSNNILFNIPPLPPIPPKVLDRVEPFANGIGAGFTATVSIGNRIFDNVVRGISAVGNRVIETGAEIADVVAKSLSKPL